MPKSKAELERLKINAQAQQVLMSRKVKSEPREGINQTFNQSTDIYQPTGEIDYTPYMRDKNNVKA